MKQGELHVLCNVPEWKPLGSMLDLFQFSDIIVYDSKTLNNLQIFEKAMEPIYYMLPFILLEVGFSPLKYKDLPNMSPFVCKRLLPTQVPQTKKRYLKFIIQFLVFCFILVTKIKKTYLVINVACSGDCGIYAIKYLEYLIADKGLDAVKDEHMRFQQKKLCVDLFYNNLASQVVIYNFLIVQ